MSIIYFSPTAAVFLLVAAFMVGACVASFINCMQIRISEHRPVTGRSQCPHCGYTLKPLDLIPIFSYIFLKGRCRSCHEKISPRYITTEVCFGAMYAIIVGFFGWQWLTLEYLVLFTILATEALWDIATFEVPDTLHILAAVNFLAFLMTHSEPVKRLTQGLIAALIYGGAVLIISVIFDKLYKKDTIGGADIKLIAVLGLYFGWKSMLLLIIISCMIGLALSAVLKVGWQKAFPFIPALCISALICAIIAEPFINWYTGLFYMS